MKVMQVKSTFVPRGAAIAVKALCLITCISLFLFSGFASGQANPEYGDCSVTTVGSPANGPNPTDGMNMADN